MNRRVLTVLSSILVVGVSSGCATFESSDTAARVGDESLSIDTLADLVEALPSSVALQSGNATSGPDVRNALTFWIQGEAVAAELDALGIEIDDNHRAIAEEQLYTSIAGYGDLPANSQAALLRAVSASAAVQEAPPVAEADVIEFYELGPEGSGITCAAHILVETEEQAVEIVAELDAGGDFATLAQQQSIDPGGAQGGVLPCTPTGSFTQQYVPEFVEGTLALAVGEISDPVASDFGFHVIRVREYDEILPEMGTYFSSPDFRLTRALADTDVWVKPRYGWFTDQFSVAPLG